MIFNFKLYFECLKNAKMKYKNDLMRKMQRQTMVIQVLQSKQYCVWRACQQPKQIEKFVYFIVVLLNQTLKIAQNIFNICNDKLFRLCWNYSMFH